MKTNPEATAEEIVAAVQEARALTGADDPVVRRLARAVVTMAKDKPIRAAVQHGGGGGMKTSHGVITKAGAPPTAPDA